MKTLFLFVLTICFGFEVQANSAKLRDLLGRYCGEHQICLLGEPQPQYQFRHTGRTVRGNISNLAANYIVLQNVEVSTDLGWGRFTARRGDDARNLVLANSICSYFGAGFRSDDQPIVSVERNQLQTVRCIHGRTRPDFRQAYLAPAQPARDNSIGQTAQAAGKAIQPNRR